MSLFGALASGVSGLTAQSSAMGAISDNITNINTIGFKGTKVNFQTLVTKQTSSTFYSAGGVQSKPRQDTGLQGLLQASTASTDIAISGKGFFVVNEAGVPGDADQYLFTRAGSFFADAEGYLRNTAGYYLQGWPTTAGGVVTPATKTLTIANQNIISRDYLASVNLNRVGGSAAATTTIAIGANLPSTDAAAATHKTDVQFFDSLGNANTASFLYTKTNRDNQWDVGVTPPTGVAVTTLYDGASTPLVYKSVGQLEFTARPADGATVVIDSITYEFDTKAFSTVTPSAGVTVSGTNLITAAAGTFTGLVAGDSVTITNSEDAGNNATWTVTAVAGDGSTISITGLTNSTAAPDTTMTVTYFNGGAGQTATRRRVDISATTTLAQDVAKLVDAVKAWDTDYADYGAAGTYTNSRIAVSANNTATVIFTEDGTGSMIVNPAGLLSSTSAFVVKQESSFTVDKINTKYTTVDQFKFSGVPANGDTVIVNGITYTFTTGEAADSTGANATIYRGGTLAQTLADLESAIEAQDPDFAAAGTGVRIREANGDTTAIAQNVLILESLSKGSYDFKYTSSTITVASPDGATSYTSGTAYPVDTAYALIFSSAGLLQTININALEVKGFSNGAADMNNQNNNKRITLDFGTVGEANGMTQFGASYTPVFITQNGSQFGTFAGVQISQDGLVTALFDNGETRPVYRLPIATFTNVNGLEGKSGNVWNQTQYSGDYTLRVANTGPAGAVIQSSLEQSTVDIGEEFTSMIVVQRAYAAAAKIISTADAMLEQLMQVKR